MVIVHQSPAQCVARWTAAKNAGIGPTYWLASYKRPLLSDSVSVAVAVCPSADIDSKDRFV